MRSYRLGLYDADPDSKVHKFGKLYPATPENERVLRLAIRMYNEIAAANPSRRLLVGAFPARSRPTPRTDRRQGAQEFGP